MSDWGFPQTQIEISPINSFFLHFKYYTFLALANFILNLPPFWNSLFPLGLTVDIIY